MKTLKQIREEYNGKYVSQVEVLPEELMLESKPMNVIPSPREMPSLLIFRRVSFRSYPKGNVVALYYSKMLDKYLSIPFGPTGNLNLSESTIHDTLEEASKCMSMKEQGSSATRYTERPTYEEKVAMLRKQKMEEGLGDYIEQGRQALIKTKAFKTAQEIGHNLPGYEDVKAAKQHFAKGEYKDAAKSTLHSLGKAAATGVGTAAAVGATALGLKGIKNLAKKALSAGGDDEKDDKKDSGDKEVVNIQPRDKEQAKAKTSSSWSMAPDKDPVYQAKMKQAALKENKIIDIRTMVKEGVDNMDLSINGRQVTLNTTMAKRILEVYDSVNTKNKKIVEGMLNEDLESFKKLLNFSIRK